MMISAFIKLFLLMGVMRVTGQQFPYPCEHSPNNKSLYIEGTNSTCIKIKKDNVCTQNMCCSMEVYRFEMLLHNGMGENIVYIALNNGGMNAQYEVRNNILKVKDIDLDTDYCFGLPNNMTIFDLCGGACMYSIVDPFGWCCPISSFYSRPPSSPIYSPSFHQPPLPLPYPISPNFPQAPLDPPSFPPYPNYPDYPNSPDSPPVSRDPPGSPSPAILSPPPQINFPYCECRTISSRFTLEYIYSPSASEHCFQVQIRDTCPVPLSPCCEFTLNKIEFDINPVCLSGIQMFVVNGIVRSPNYSRNPGPVAKVTNLNIPFNMTNGLEVCMHMSSICTSLEKFCNGDTCRYAIFESRETNTKCCVTSTTII